jgi:acyl-CoA synthetase (AMP-forming)/AMP-acid ligase II
MELIGRHPPSSIAVVDADRRIETSYGELRDRVGDSARRLRETLGRGLVFLATTSTTESIALYLACLEASCPVLLLDPETPARWVRLLEAYQPQALLTPTEVALPAGWEPGSSIGDGTYHLGLRASSGVGLSPHSELALLLTTSGSTGNPKVARLAGRNVVANAQSIVEYLGIGPGERSIQSLPLHYSYGLSLINSHLLTGARVVLTRHSFWRGEFWEAFDRTSCTSIAGVPHIYESLHRLRFNPSRHGSLKTMTQAGGALRPDLVQSFCDAARAAGARFFVMYGQTEACARMSYVPWQRLHEKIGSIGVAIPGGEFSLAPLEGGGHELVYSGPNVMMGYAQAAADLAKGDELHGVLRTGDLARVDKEGFYYLTGRLNRFAKLFGRRVSLDDVEKDLETRFGLQVAATDRNGQLAVYVAPRGRADTAAITLHLAVDLGVPPKTIRVTPVDAIPLTASGKKNYPALTE